MQPDDRRHGTYAGAQAHLASSGAVTGCARCAAAYRRYQNRAANERLLGYGPRRVPTAEVTERIHALVAAGMSVLDIAARAGVSHSTVTELKNQPRARVLESTRDALMGVTLVLTPEARVCGIGTLRRIRALARLGWSYDEMNKAARDAGHHIPGHALDQINSTATGTVEVKTREAVAAAYATLSMRLPDRSRGSSCVRTRAERKGWAPPLAWDDIDDPAAEPYAPAPKRGIEAHVVDNIEFLTNHGERIAGISARLGITPGSIHTQLGRAGRSDIWWRLAAREPDAALRLSSRRKEAS